MNSVRHPLLIFIILLMALSIPFNALPEETALNEVRHVLLLNSYHQRMTWVKDIVRGVEEVLQPNENNLTLHIENMDSKVFNSDQYFSAFKQYLKVKYQDTKFSLILSSDNHAFDFIRDNSKELFPGVPISFCGVNDFQLSMLAGFNTITGVAEIFSARETVDLALQLHPTVQEIFIINDYLKTGRAWAKNIDNDLQDFREKIRIRHSQNLPIAELMAEISNLPENSLVLLGVYFSDRDNTYFTYERIGAMLSEASSVPVYALLEFNLGKGVVGGRVISGFYQGREMAKIGKRILNGEKPSDIPVRLQGSNRLVFDYLQLEKFNIAESVLPKETHIINRPYSFYNEYKLQIWVLILFITLLLAAITALGLNFIRRLRAEKELKVSEERFRQLANATWEAIIIHKKGILLQANETFYEMFGFENNTLQGEQMMHKIIASDSLETVTNRVKQKMLSPYEVTALRSNGTTFPIEIRVREMEYRGEKVRMAAIRDLSERKQLEDRLAQSQKLEAIGTLAGGIAHDFNNILAAILGYAELLQLKLTEKSDNAKYIDEILRAGHRAKDLVQQILTFARKSKEEKHPIQAALVVKEALKLLRATLPSSIEIQSDIRTTASVLSDSTQLHQVMMNLCTNARKAMKDGGILSVFLKDVVLDETFTSSHVGISPGQYIQLTIRDTGSGMTEEVKNRIFDPFFTTREQGEGTGLGLSVVHGIVKECRGLITVQSEPGQGSTFSIYLPVIDETTDEPVSAKIDIPQGQGRILFVDDEQPLAEMAGTMLQSLGYTVSIFSNGPEALYAFKKDPTAFDMIITDMTMPKISGDQFAREALAIRPDIPVVICTGYTEKLTAEQATQIGVKDFVMKPVQMAQLAEIVRVSLNSNQEALRK